MAITYLGLKIKNPEKPRLVVAARFLVDSGAVYSVVPSPVLKKLGIKPTHSQRFTLANGEVIEKKVGNALFEFRGKVGASPVVFGEEKIYLLGAVTLESFGVILDPINRELKPLPMLLMGFCRGSSVVELAPEERGVVSSILTPGTKRGSSSAAERLVANEKAAGANPVSRSTTKSSLRPKLHAA